MGRRLDILLEQEELEEVGLAVILEGVFQLLPELIVEVVVVGMGRVVLV